MSDTFNITTNLSGQLTDFYSATPAVIPGLDYRYSRVDGDIQNVAPFAPTQGTVASGMPPQDPASAMHDLAAESDAQAPPWSHTAMRTSPPSSPYTGMNPTQQALYDVTDQVRQEFIGRGQDPSSRQWLTDFLFEVAARQDAIRMGSSPASEIPPVDQEPAPPVIPTPRPFISSVPSLVPGHDYSRPYTGGYERPYVPGGAAAPEESWPLEPEEPGGAAAEDEVAAVTVAGAIGKASGQSLTKLGAISAAYNVASNIQSAYEPNVSGTIGIQEQQNQRAESSALVGVTTILGAGIGSLIPGIGTLAGGAGGAAVGGLIKNYWDTSAAGSTYNPERSGNEIAFGQGGNAQTVREFVTALQGATKATSDYAEVAAKMAQFGPVDPTKLPVYLGTVESRLGTAGPHDVLGAAQFLASSPAYGNASDRLGRGTIGKNELGAYATIAMASGDYGSAADLTALTLMGTPQADRDAFQQDMMRLRGDQRVAAATPELYQGALTTYAGEMSLAQLTGARAETLTPVAAQITTTTTEAANRYNPLIADLRRQLAHTSDYDARAALLAQINNAGAAQIALHTDAAASARTAYVANLQQGISGLSVDVSGEQLGVYRAAYDSSKTADDIVAAQRSLATGQGTLSAGYQHYADDPNSPLVPAERNQYLNLARSAESDRLRLTYESGQQFQGIGVATQANVVRGLEANIAVQQATGSPESVAAAIADVVPALTAEIKKLTDQISTASATDKPGLEARRIALQQDLALLTPDQIKGQYAGEQGIRAADIGAGVGFAQFSAKFFGGSSQDVSRDITNALTGDGSPESKGGLYQSLVAAQALSVNPTVDEGTQAQARADIARLTGEIGGVVDTAAAAAGTFTPAQNIAVMQSEGAINRLGMGYAMQGNLQDSYMALRSNLASELRSLDDNRQRLRADLPDALRPEFDQQTEAQRQQLLSSEAQAGYEVNKMFGQNLPAMLVGGTSFSARLMPSRAQAAAAIEDKYPTIAAYTFGSYHPESARSLMAGDDTGYLAGGKSSVTTHPANQTIQGIAESLGVHPSTLTSPTAGHDSLAYSAQTPLPGITHPTTSAATTPAPEQTVQSLLSAIHELIKTLPAAVTAGVTAGMGNITIQVTQDPRSGTSIQRGGAGRPNSLQLAPTTVVGGQNRGGGS